MAPLNHALHRASVYSSDATIVTSQVLEQGGSRVVAPAEYVHLRAQGRTDILQRLNDQVSPAQSWPLSVVHPRKYQDVVDKLQLASRRVDCLSQRPFMELVGAMGPSALRAIRRRLKH